MTQRKFDPRGLYGKQRDRINNLHTVDVTKTEAKGHVSLL